MISKRSIFILLMAFVVAMQTHAQDKRPKFSPEKFKADMEQFIVKEACLTPEESAKFFPVYDEMQKKLQSRCRANSSNDACIMFIMGV